MKLIVRYLISKCVINVILMLLVFIMLFSAFNVIGEISDLGKGSYNTLSMFIYVGALIPNFAYLLMPLAVLIGVMITMLSMVHYSEYAILRTSGFSLRSITLILFSVGAVFSVVTLLLGEVVAPTADHFAKVYKITRTHDVISTKLRSGVWSRDGGNDFVNIQQVMPDNTILGLRVFKYAKSDGKLLGYMEAAAGTFNKVTHTWVLDNVTYKNYTYQNIITTKLPQLIWNTSINPSYFSVLVVAPEDMSALALIKYINHLRKNKQSTQRYQVTFWNKLLYPLACVSMALLALAFTPNNRRNINLSSKLFFGIIIGVAFFFVTKLVGFMALLFNWNAMLANFGPTAILFFLGWYFVLRKE